MRTVRSSSLAPVLAAFLSASAPGAEGPSPAAKVDALFASRARTDGPGCAVAVVKDGRTVLEKGYGMADLEQGLPITPASVFYVGSVAKQFTAAVVALLARDGVLGLDDDVRKWVPELPGYGAPVTVRQLVHHTAGVRDFWGLVGLAGRRYDDAWSQEEVLALLARQKGLNNVPGARYLYSNGNYALLATVVARASGRSLREEAARLIFGPVGMTRTVFRDDHTAIVPGRIPGHAPRAGGGFRLALVNNDLAGAGGLWTTVQDLARWDAALASGTFGGEGLVRLLETPGTLADGRSTGYGFGLARDTYRGLDRIGHEGVFSGYRAAWHRYPAGKLSVGVLCNLGSVDPGRLAEEVADAFFPPGPAPAAAGPSRPAAAPASDELARLAGLYWSPADGGLRTIGVSGGTLTVDGHPLEPAGPGRFRAPGGGADGPELAFTGAGAGRGLTVTAPGTDPTRYEPVRAAALTAAELAAYAGTYRSDELDVRFVLSASAGKLLLSRGQAPRTELVPVAPGVVADAELGSLRAVREGGAVAALILDGPRAKGLRFVRDGP